MSKAWMFASLALLTVAGMSPASAGVVYSNTFDTEAGGGSSLNYTAFSGLTVSQGTVDVIKSGDFGLTCSGSCVDLDGSTNSGGEITTTNGYAFNAGDLVTLSFDLGGSQRGDGPNPFTAGFRFDSDTGLSSFTTGGGFGDSTVTNVAPLSQTVYDGTSISTDPFQTFTLSFRATTGGVVRAYLGTDSSDSVGPLADNFSLSVAAVPEPATWAMMIGGFGLVGGTLRRRATKIAYA